MDSLPELDTTRAASSYVRDSFASVSDSTPNSARNSYFSISEASDASSRTSYSLIKDSPGQESNFSRTADAVHPSSVEDTPTNSSELSRDTRWGGKEPTEMSGQRPSGTDISPEPEAKPVAKDGPTALKELQNVKEVMCVAFGAFDRYYISWEDNDGKFHQVSRNLPKCLNNWLYPTDGTSRHLPSLQVAFGSNDEFFASDDNSKLSSRDQCCQDAETKPVSRLAEITRGMIRKKSYSVSSPKTTGDMAAQIDPTPSSPRHERGKSLQVGQQNASDEPRQTIVPLGNRPQLTRWESKGDVSRAEKRRSLLGMPAWAPSSDPVPETLRDEPVTLIPASEPVSMQSAELKAQSPDEKSTSSFFQRLTQFQQPSPEAPKPENVQQARSTFMRKVLSTPSVDLKPIPFKEEPRVGLFAGMLKKTPPTEAKPELPKEQAKSSPQGMLGTPEVKSELSLETQMESAVIDAPSMSKPLAPMRSPFNEQLQPTSLDVQLELQKASERRNILNSVPPARPSWPDRRTLQRLSAMQRMGPVRSNYVDAGVQTEIIEVEACLPPRTLDAPVYIPAPHSVSIGSMSDFFRGQYRLGDALHYV